MTLEGTNTYVYGADPCVVIDPELRRRGPPRGDPRGGGRARRHRPRPAHPLPRRPHRGRRPARRRGRAARPAARPTPACAPSPPPATPPTTSAFLTEDGVCFSGDLVLGLGSTIVPPGGGSLAAYMDSLRLLQAEEIELIAPGHGPWITDPAAKLAEYVEHREMRERSLLAALERGERSRAALLADGLGRRPGRAAADGGDGDGGPPRKARGRGPAPGRPRRVVRDRQPGQAARRGTQSAMARLTRSGAAGRGSSPGR